MEKTKLGISLTLTAFIIVCAAYFGGYIPALLLTGYVFLKEENVWLKRTALETVLLLILFSALSLVIRLIPYVLDIPESLLEVFNCYVLSDFITVIARLENLLDSILTVVKIVAFAAMGFLALSGKSIHIAFLDKYLDTIQPENRANQ